MTREPDAVRDRYGRTKIGQSLLLARRLVEAGVQMVSYNAFNQEWDTHGDLFNRYKHLMPITDQAYRALIEDLAERGMLDDTLVINTGEFGRTPIINKEKGRDHWPNVYTTVLAGGGIRGGQVYGASDKKGAPRRHGRRLARRHARHDVAFARRRSRNRDARPAGPATGLVARPRSARDFGLDGAC